MLLTAWSGVHHCYGEKLGRNTLKIPRAGTKASSHRSPELLLQSSHLIHMHGDHEIFLGGNDEDRRLRFGSTDAPDATCLRFMQRRADGDSEVLEIIQNLGASQ